jgi:hypothetical protein
MSDTLETTTKKCAHPGCHCVARADSDYCSAYCEHEAKNVEAMCKCGHMNCLTAKEARVEPNEARMSP